MIAWFEEHGWPRTAEIGPEFADKMRSRNYAGLKIHCHNMPDETHMSVPPAVISRGLRYVFDHWEPSSSGRAVRASVHSLDVGELEA
jgi:hypothetical protein